MIGETSFRILGLMPTYEIDTESLKEKGKIPSTTLAGCLMKVLGSNCQDFALGNEGLSKKILTVQITISSPNVVYEMPLKHYMVCRQICSLQTPSLLTS